MDQPLRSTLLAEGPSDRALLPIIRLTLEAHLAPSVLLADPRQADYTRMPRRIRDDPGAWIRTVIAEEPCDLLFIHRDADKDDDAADDAGRPKRLAEIAEWFAEAALPHESGVDVVPVIPVRMTETWLLADEQAIRRAAGNPHGTTALSVPRLAELEGRHGVKAVLANAIKQASGLRAGRLRTLNVGKTIARIAVEDLKALRRLRAFAAFEHEVSAVCKRRGWCP